MNVLLVVPINRSYVVAPRLGLGYVAAVARRAGHSVTILDALARKMSYEDFGRYLGSHRFDVIGFQLFTYDLPSVARHLEWVRRVSPDAVTVAGGAHPSGAPTHTLEWLTRLDYAFQGEAEEGFPLLLAALGSGRPSLGDVPGLIYRDTSGRICVNPPAWVQDLDSLPMVAWDLMAPETYPEAPHGAFSRRFPTAPIVCTRGCAHRCTFCAGRTVSGGKVRKRSVDHVIEELHQLRARGIREFHVEDENFTAHRSLVLTFCDRLLSEGLDMTWSLPAGVRIDRLDRELLEAMERAGCYSLALGLEFGTQRLLDLTGKRITLELVRDKLELFHGLNIKTTGFFLFGLPGETLEEMRQTLRFALELPLDRAQFNHYIPLPGSALWTELEAAGKLGRVEWDRFYVHDVAYWDGAVSSRERKRLQQEAYLRFYLRPRLLSRLLREVRSLRHLRYLLSRLHDSLS